MAITTATQSASLSSHLSERKIPHSGYYSLLPADPPVSEWGRGSKTRVAHGSAQRTKEAKATQTLLSAEFSLNMFQTEMEAEGREFLAGLNRFRSFLPSPGCSPAERCQKAHLYTTHTVCVCVGGCVEAERKPQILLA